MSEFDTEKKPDEVIKKYFGKSDSGSDEEPKEKKSHFYRNFIICIVIISLCLGSVSFGLSAAGLSPKINLGNIFASDEKEAETEAEQENNGLFGSGSEAVPMSYTAESIYEASTNRVNLIKRVKPSVVAISTVSYAQDFFFGTRQVSGSGSGFIFAKDAYNVYIATNNHVVSGAVDLTVSFDENTVIPGKVAATDQNADLAVVTIKTSDLKEAGINNVTVVSFGDSTKVNVGDPVIAIGNALGEGITATAGVVSVISKKINIQGKTLDVIQIDSAINPGNSGGPLFNSKGEVIGITTAKLSSATIEGIGYCIASSAAAPVFKQLAEGNSAPTLGVTVTAVPKEYVSQLGTSAGAYVIDVTKGGNAYMAGIQVGDIITSFNGNAIFGPDQLVENIKQCKSNDVVEITGIRNAQTFKVKTTLYPPKN